MGPAVADQHGLGLGQHVGVDVGGVQVVQRRDDRSGLGQVQRTLGQRGGDRGPPPVQGLGQLLGAVVAARVVQGARVEPGRHVRHPVVAGDIGAAHHHPQPQRLQLRADRGQPEQRLTLVAGRHEHRVHPGRGLQQLLDAGHARQHRVGAVLAVRCSSMNQPYPRSDALGIPVR